MIEKNVKPSLAKANRALARQWHPTKNAPLTPRAVTYGSSKKVWWVCKKGHEWQATVHARTGRGNGCPYCSGRVVSKDNCLSTRNPKLAREWHPTRNAPLTPADVAAGTQKKAWWICAKGHEWEAQVTSRNRGAGCPYCTGNRVNRDNCLQTVNPALAAQWHPTKNAPLTPKDVTQGSEKKVWWVCKKDHTWQAPIGVRKKGVGCPYCANKRACKENCLQTRNPKLAREWHPTRNAPLTAKDVTYGSEKKVWWLCKKGHEWEYPVFSRNQGNGCPFCSGRRATKENCLQTVSPSIAKEWHPTKNGSWTPKDVSPFSKRNVSWKCKMSHERREPIIGRYKRGGCPVCTLKAREPRLFETV